VKALILQCIRKAVVTRLQAEMEGMVLLHHPLLLHHHLFFFFFFYQFEESSPFSKGAW
jgi:hypothetical protein